MAPSSSLSPSTKNTFQTLWWNTTWTGRKVRRYTSSANAPKNVELTLDKTRKYCGKDWWKIPSPLFKMKPRMPMACPRPKFLWLDNAHATRWPCGSPQELFPKMTSGTVVITPEPDTTAVFLPRWHLQTLTIAQQLRTLPQSPAQPWPRQSFSKLRQQNQQLFSWAHLTSLSSDIPLPSYTDFDILNDTTSQLCHSHKQQRLDPARKGDKVWHCPGNA